MKITKKIPLNSKQLKLMEKDDVQSQREQKNNIIPLRTNKKKIKERHSK